MDSAGSGFAWKGKGGIRIVGERESGGGSFTLNGGDGGFDGRGMDVGEVERGRGR